jgi:hypothetical protein
MLNLIDLFSEFHPSTFVTRGMYDQQLALWRRYFPSRSLCIVSYEMLNDEPARALDVVSRFIGLADFKWQDIVGSIRNTSYADTVCLKVIFSHFAQFEDQIAFNRI